MKKDMKNLKFNGKIVIAIMAIVVCAIALFCIDFNGNSVIEAGVLKENYDYGEFTFLREMELASGKKAYYYESGNEYYSYSHDNEGYVLVKDEERGILEYAVNEGGKPVSSGVSYGSDKVELSKIVRMQGSEIDLSNPEVQESIEGLDGMTIIETEPVLASGTSYVSITNLTIFISFKYESFVPDEALLNKFNGASNSLKNYYQEISNDRVNINSQIAYDTNGAVYVYQDSQPRDYYNTNSSTRWPREVELVANAIEGAKKHYSFASNTNLDVNNDGYIDSVSIVVHGKSSSVWGSLLWPHSVSLDAVDGENNYTEVATKKVGKYSFNFSEDITLGVLCHETAHVLGAPDLYHYGTTTQNQDIVAVGKWDLMEIDLDTPQYLLAYMRKNYVGGIADSQIGTISSNGTYSLKPVTKAGETDVIAYKIPTAKDEYFMVEYRRATPSSYDSMLPGSGLIIYRVKEPADFNNSRGNMDAVYKGTGSRADEVYVFRPSIKMTGVEAFASERYKNSLYDIDYAYLSPDNPYFSKVGKENSYYSYDFETLYYSDGSNSEIVIEALSLSEDSMEFSVKLGQDMVLDSYFDNKISIESAKLVDSTDYAGVAVNVKFGSLNTQYLSALQIELYDADGNVVVTNDMNIGRFIPEYNGGMRESVSKFVFSDKGNDTNGGIFSIGSFRTDNEPVKAVLKITDADGDEKILEETTIEDSANIGWSTIVNAKTELKAFIKASTRMTVGVKRDGSVDASGNFTTGQWAIEGVSDVTDIALGYTHTLLLTKRLSVIAVGEDKHDEAQVASWSNVMAVAAGTYSSYGLTTVGKVLATGLNDQQQLEVSSWTSIKQISAIGKRVAGLTHTGLVVVAGNYTESEKMEISMLSNVKQVEVGINFLAALKHDGTVEIVGTLPSADLTGFVNVAKISAGTHHILALTEDGKVLATGDNSYGQSRVNGLYDVIDVAAGECHSAFLREDGVVEYRGTGSANYGTNEGVGNLLYSNYVSLTRISDVTGVSGGKISIQKGSTLPIGVIYEPTNATYVRMLFTSSNTAVATVEATERKGAVITALEVGISTLTIKDHGTGITYVVNIEVREEERPISGIAFTEEERTIPEGESAYLSIIFLPEGVNSGALVPTFSSSDSSLVSVDEAGKIQALAGSIGKSVTITAEAAGFTAQIVVRVVSAVTKIEFVVKEGEDSTKARLYRYGEELDLTRYLLIVTSNYTHEVEGEQITEEITEEVALTSDMVSGYNKNDKSSAYQTIKINYSGNETTFTVSVKDYVVSVEKISEPIKKYLYNHDLAISSGEFRVYMASGENTTHKFLSSNYEGYSKNVIGVQNVIYVFKDNDWGTQFIFEEEITVVDYVNSISFRPLRNTYYYGEEIDRHEFVDLNMISGATRQIQLIECVVKDENAGSLDENSPYYALNSLIEGYHTIKVSFVDPETQEEKSTTATIDVKIGGNFQIIGRDETEFCYYYEVGSDPYMDVTLVQPGVEELKINKYQEGDEGIYYKLYSLGAVENDFDNTISGKDQDAMIKIFVKSQTIVGGNIVVSLKEVWSLSINARPLAQTISVKIKDGSIKDYKYGHVINADKDNLDVELEKTLVNGSKAVFEPMEIVYDSEIIGKQILKARYLDEWYELEIIINDYAIELLPISNVTIIWGQPISFKVYAIYARGGKTQIYEKVGASDGYTVSYYSNEVVGEQEVIVSYENSYTPTITTSFGITILDEFKGISITKTPKREYELGESFDPTSTYEIIMISGAKKTLLYNDVDFSWSPDFNSKESAIDIPQTISIYYNGEGVSAPYLVWSDTCKVPNFVKRLEVLESSSKKEYTIGEELSIKVMAYFAKNSASLMLGNTDFGTTYNPQKVGKQEIVVSYVYNGKTYTTTFVVEVIDTIIGINIVSSPNLVSYGYGDVLDWTGAKVNVSYASAGVVKYEGEAIKEYLDVSYTTLIAGQQKVTLTGGKQSVFFNISVTRESQAVEAVNGTGVTANVAKRQIAFEETATIGDVVGALKVSNYLTAQYVSVQFGEIVLSGNLNKRAGTGDKLVYVNRGGIMVFEFVVYIKGDVNGDGKITLEDLSGMAQGLAQGTAKNEIVDYNGDGKSNLTDLVGYARETGGGTPKQVPVHDVARTFITTPSRLKSKENQYE